MNNPFLAQTLTNFRSLDLPDLPPERPWISKWSRQMRSRKLAQRRCRL